MSIKSLLFVVLVYTNILYISSLATKPCMLILFYLVVLFLVYNETFSVINLTGIITNLSDQYLFLLDINDCNNVHGIFSSSPPTSIEPQSSVPFKAISDGTSWIEGSCRYYIGKNSIDYVDYNWDVPLIGSNQYSADVSGEIPYIANYSGGSGFNATVIFTLKNV